MWRRLLFGLLKGVLLGTLLALALVRGLGLPVVESAFLAYPLAAITGALAGLVTGKPFWAQDGRVEGGLKAFFGAALAAGLMFALRGWAAMPLDLSGMGLGAGTVASLPAVALPLITTLLALVFELDNDGASKPAREKEPPAKKRLEEPGAGSARLEEADHDLLDLDASEERRRKL